MRWIMIFLLIVIFLALDKTEKFGFAHRRSYRGYRPGIYSLASTYSPPIRGSYVDFYPQSRKYALPHWYSRATLRQQGLIPIPADYYYDDYYY